MNVPESESDGEREPKSESDGDEVNMVDQDWLEAELTLARDNWTPRTFQGRPLKGSARQNEGTLIKTES